MYNMQIYIKILCPGMDVRLVCSRDCSLDLRKWPHEQVQVSNTWSTLMQFQCKWNPIGTYEERSRKGFWSPSEQKISYISLS